MSLNLNPILTFGLPLGSALVLTAFTSTITTYEAMMFLAEVVYSISSSSGVHFRHELSVLIKINLFWRALELISHIIFMWYGTIVKRRQYFLKAWLVGQMGFLVIWEMELLVVFLKSAFSERGFSSILLAIFTASYHLAFYGYMMHVGYRSMSSMEPVDSTSSELEPVGKSLDSIAEFYKVNTWAGATLAVMMEVILTLSSICVQIASNFGDTFGNETIMVLENIFVRYTRFILCIFAFVLLQKNKRQLLSIWCVGYFLVLVMSLALFGYSIGSGWTYFNSFAVMHFYSSFFFSLIFRAWVLFKCLRFLGIGRCGRMNRTDQPDQS